MTRPSGPAYGWVIVAAGALMTCVSMGSMFSLAVFLQPMSADNGWSRTGISTAMTISFLAMAVAVVPVGCAERSLRAAHRCALRQPAAGARPGAGERRLQPRRVPASVWPLHWRSGRRLLRADDGSRLGVVRPEPQPCGGASFRRRRDGIADRGAVCALADRRLLVATGDADRRHRRDGTPSAGCPADAPAARRSRDRGGAATGRPYAGCSARFGATPVGRRGAAHPSVRCLWRWPTSLAASPTPVRSSTW